jgi:hypothetical protein
VGKMAAWAAAEYRFTRDTSSNQVVWAGDPRNHGAGVFPNMPHWLMWNNNWSKSCDWHQIGGPCIPDTEYWETSYGAFDAQFPVPGVHWTTRIWSVGVAKGDSTLDKPCGINQRIQVLGPDGYEGEELPAAGTDKALVCVPVTSGGQ